MTKPTSRPARRAIIQARTRALAGSHGRVTAALAAAEAAGEDQAPAGTSTPAKLAELWLYGVVGGYWWGFDAETVADALRTIPDDVEEIRVRLHSPGGAALEGVAIGNLLRNHPARVTVVVDGLAASAASVLMLGGDDVVLSPGSLVMIHDASTYTYGNAAQLRSEAAWIDKMSANYATVYATRGGTAEEWREAMTADDGRGTWYTAPEAVEAGLADREGVIASVSPPPPEPTAEEAEVDESEMAARAAFDRDVLCHPDAWAAWARTPGALTRPPNPPTASADGTTPTEGNAMSLSDAATKTLTAKLGIAGDADEATILAALDEVLDEQTDTSAAGTSTATASAVTVPEGMVLMDAQTAEALRTQAAEGAQARQVQRDEHRDRVLDAAIRVGKFPPARREHFATAWAADPQGTEDLIGKLAAGLVPVEELGHDQAPTASTDAATTEDGEAIDAFARMFGLTGEDLTNA